MNNIIVEPPPVDPYAKWKRVIAETKSVTAKMTPFIDFLTKSLPLAAAAATATSYISLLGYTSRYSIPFPYTFLPYLVMFSVVVVLALMVMGLAAFFPLYLRVVIPDTEYHKMLKVGAEGGLLWWRRCPQLIRQFVNLIAPAIAFEFAMVVDVAFQDIKNLTPPVGGVLFFLALVLQGFFFAYYIKDNHKLKYDSKNL